MQHSVTTPVPATRRNNRVVHLAAPTNSMSDRMRTVADVNNVAANDRTANGIPVVPSTKAHTLCFHGPFPSTVVVTTPRKESLHRHYVYFLAAARVGTAAVKTESGIKVVYLTPEQADYYQKHFIIGALPWLSLSAATRAYISSIHKQ